MKDASPLNELAGLRILLVEDMLMVADEIARMLHETGCEVIGPYGSVADALVAAREQAFDAALLDINLNNELGYAVADELIARGKPFIFMSGYGAESIQAPFDQYPRIEKPFTRSELGEAMQKAFCAAESR